MTTARIGAATITRIEETYGLFFEARTFFADWRDEIVAEHLPWMVPDHFDPASGFLKLSDTATTLFSEEFMLHLPGGPYHYPAPTVMAFLSGSGEILFPILLVLGLGTRFAALGLLLMTAIVELTVPDGWPIHITWAAMALGIMAYGPGRISLDHLLSRLVGVPGR